MGLVSRLHRPCLSRKARFGTRTRNTSSTTAPILNIPKANVYRFGEATRATPVFRDLEWSIKLSESWAVVGSGSGEKSSVFDMLNGHLRIHPPPPPPGGLFPFLSDEDPHKHVSMVSFANKRTVGGAFYDYTARYGAVREEDRITLRESMFPETIHDLKAQSRISLEPTSTDERLFEYLVQRMDLVHLLDLPRIALSNGQTRRARILKALLGKPRLLLLDEPLTGLDVANRATMQSILHELHAACNPHVIMGLRMQDPIPDWITHLAVVDAGQVKTGQREEILQYRRELRAAREDAKTQSASMITKERTAGEPVVEMKNVSVTYGPRKVLKNITWTIHKGERYHLQGMNGSGKTTLLSLLTGDHPQSYTQLSPASASASIDTADSERHLRLFGTPRPKLATPSIHARIGVLTPELFDAFPRRAPGMSVWEAVGTGFEGGFVPRGADGVGLGPGGALSEAERAWRVGRCWAVLGALGPGAWGTAPSTSAATPPASSPSPTRSSSPPASLSDDLPPPPANTPVDPATRAFAAHPFLSLPIGAQRMVLLMRALVGQPPLVLLDEVWSGMDAGMVDAARAYLRGEGAGAGAGGVTADQAVVVVTHLEEEVPWGVRDGVLRVLLKDGELSVVGEED